MIGKLDFLWLVVCDGVDDVWWIGVGVMVWKFCLVGICGWFMDKGMDFWGGCCGRVELYVVIWFFVIFDFVCVWMCGFIL